MRILLAAILTIQFSLSAHGQSSAAKKKSPTPVQIHVIEGNRINFDETTSLEGAASTLGKSVKKFGGTEWVYNENLSDEMIKIGKILNTPVPDPKTAKIQKPKPKAKGKQKVVAAPTPQAPAPVAEPVGPVEPAKLKLPADPATPTYNVIVVQSPMITPKDAGKPAPRAASPDEKQTSDQAQGEPARLKWAPEPGPTSPEKKNVTDKAPASESTAESLPPAEPAKLKWSGEPRQAAAPTELPVPTMRFPWGEGYVEFGPSSVPGKLYTGKFCKDKECSQAHIHEFGPEEVIADLFKGPEQLAKEAKAAEEEHGRSVADQAARQAGLTAKNGGSRKAADQKEDFYAKILSGKGTSQPSAGPRETSIGAPGGRGMETVAGSSTSGSARVSDSRVEADEVPATKAPATRAEMDGAEKKASGLRFDKGVTPEFSEGGDNLCIVGGYLNMSCKLLSTVQTDPDFIHERNEFIKKRFADSGEKTMRCNPAFYPAGAVVQLPEGDWKQGTFLNNTAIKECNKYAAASAPGQFQRVFLKNKEGIPGEAFVLRMQDVEEACGKDTNDFSNNYDATVARNQEAGCSRMTEHLEVLVKKCDDYRTARGPKNMVCTMDELQEARAKKEAAEQAKKVKTTTGGGFGGFIKSMVSSEWFPPMMMITAALFFYWLMTKQMEQQMNYNYNFFNQGTPTSATPYYYTNPTIRGTP